MAKYNEGVSCTIHIKKKVFMHLIYAFMYKYKFYALNFCGPVEIVRANYPNVCVL